LTAGCGKSVLTSSIIDALTTSKSHTVAYYFCDYVDKRTLDPLAVWGSITRQLLEIREMPLTVEKLLERNFGDDKTSDLQVLRETLSAVIQLFPDVMIILDGIDEIDDDSQKIFYSTLNKLIQDAGPILKLLVSCRDDATHALRTPAGTSFRVHLQPANIAIDIEDYIRYSVKALLESGELVVQDSLLQEIMIETLVKGAQGMWVFSLDV
jgi:Cdc6-like AAA superfamily ATPase